MNFFCSLMGTCDMEQDLAKDQRVNIFSAEEHMVFIVVTHLKHLVQRQA